MKAICARVFKRRSELLRQNQGDIAMRALPSKVKTLLSKKVFAHLATLMPDGSPQVSTVWVDVDGDVILVNSAEGRLKDRNVRRDPRVALSVVDPDNPYQSLSIRGRVVEITHEGADAQIDRMARKYLGLDSYPYRTSNEVRVIYRISADRIAVMG
jgi:PPOX class probable F420-dependent enzyme